MSRRITRMRLGLGPNIAPSQGRNQGSGAKGTRTPDLLVANETRYQLRHSPADRGGPISTETLPPSGRGYLARFAAWSAEAESDPESGASAVTGPSWRGEDDIPGPDKSIVRTVRGASGFGDVGRHGDRNGSHRVPGASRQIRPLHSRMASRRSWRSPYGWRKWSIRYSHGESRDNEHRALSA